MPAVNPRERTGALAPFVVAIIAAAFILGAYLRLANLADNPGWDGDEGYNWSIASNLAAGQVRMYALRYAFVQHPPLFYIVGAAVMRVWTHDLIALRAITACSGILTMAALWAIGRRLCGFPAAIAAMIFYAIWPQSVLQVRWAYTYNLLALLVMLAISAALPFGLLTEGDPLDVTPKGRSGKQSPVRAAIAGVLTGLALTTDQEAIAMVPAMCALLWPGGARVMITAALAAALAPLSYIGWMLETRRSDFLFDIHHTASRLNASPGELITRLQHLVTFDPFIAVGLLGLLLLPTNRTRAAFALLAGLFILVVLEVRDPNPYFRAAEPLLPIAALGVGVIVSAVPRLLARLLAKSRARSPGDANRPHARLFARLALALLVAPIAITMIAQDISNVRGRFTPGIASLLPRSATNARAMTGWVNARVAPDDLVLVMPSTSWLFRCRTADFLQAVAIDGRGTSFYPAGLSRDRFLYDTHLTSAHFVVIDDFTRLWIRESAPERHLVDQVLKRWPAVFNLGEYTVYRNPAR